MEERWALALQPPSAAPILRGQPPEDLSESSEPSMRAADAGASDLDYAQGAPWVLLLPTGRQHWSQRVSAQAQDLGEPPAIPEPQPPLSGAGPQPRDDAVDCLSFQGPSGSPLRPHGTPDWASRWKRLNSHGLVRTHRLVAWKLLHGALPCGAQQAFIDHIRRGQPLSSVLDHAVCPSMGCTGALDTISHTYLRCPTSLRVWEWLLGVWTLASEHPPPPLVESVLLADDQTSWRPPPSLQPLWTRLRIATIYALHTASALHRQGARYSSTAVAAMLVHLLRAQMFSDRQRVDTPLSSLASTVCSSTWLRGRRPSITLVEFRVLWGKPGVLYAAQPHGRLHIRLSTSTPLQVP